MAHSAQAKVHTVKGLISLGHSFFVYSSQRELGEKIIKQNGINKTVFGICKWYRHCEENVR